MSVFLQVKASKFSYTLLPRFSKLRVFHRKRFGLPVINILVRSEEKLIRCWNVSPSIFFNLLANRLSHVFGCCCCGPNCFMNSYPAKSA